MPFHLYRLDETVYVQVREVGLAGDGPFRRVAAADPGNPEWELSERDLLQSLGEDPNQHGIITDLKPSQPTLNLYRLKYVWGYSSDGWTPMAWELEALYVDEELPGHMTLSDFKNRFSFLDGPGDRVYEFLYAQGDGQGGSWRFGRVGSVNAALLWDSAQSPTFNSFLKRINRKRRDLDGLPPLGYLD